MIPSDATVSVWLQLLDNAVLAWALMACGLAQLSKLIVELILYRRWRPAVLLETGGMPSSHSALVTGAAAGLGWGWWRPRLRRAPATGGAGLLRKAVGDAHGPERSRHLLVLLRRAP